MARTVKVRARKHLGRVDLPQVDRAAVFEPTVDALAHHNSSIRGSQVRLRLDTDRWVLASPGSLPNTLTDDSMA